MGITWCAVREGLREGFRQDDGDWPRGIAGDEMGLYRAVMVPVPWQFMHCALYIFVAFERIHVPTPLPIAQKPSTMPASYLSSAL